MFKKNLLQAKHCCVINTNYTQARSKVHVFKTLFPAYLEKAHPYEEPITPPPLCAFKFEASKYNNVRDAYELQRNAIERFGVFEFDQPPYARRLASKPLDFENKVSPFCFYHNLMMQLFNDSMKLALNLIYNFYHLIFLIKLVENQTSFLILI